MNVELPSRFNRDTMYPFIKRILDEDMLPKDNEIVFDFKRLTFIGPVGVTVLSNLIGKLHKHGARVSFSYPNPNKNDKKCPISFLDDSMFFKHYLGNTLDSTSSLRPTTLPLKNVTYMESYQYLDHAMHWLAGKLMLTKKSVGDIEMSMSEIFNNIKDHSSENNGFFFMQQFPKNDTVTVAVSDFGIGIPKNVQTKHPYLNDASAILMAINEGFTTKSTPRNRGAGLGILIDNVVRNNKGTVYIHSNGGILSCEYINNKVEIKPKPSFGFYPGTLIEMNFRTDTIEYIEEEFSWDDY
ncbi:ATP-binding protein [Paenibacillus glucanolyticus]|uniref:ATP-binding protein n=1 Tax=Paenibacillus glucanolyticus TaxID=59843 RepID=UPI0035D96F9C